MIQTATPLCSCPTSLRHTLLPAQLIVIAGAWSLSLKDSFCCGGGLLVARPCISLGRCFVDIDGTRFNCSTLVDTVGFDCSSVDTLSDCISTFANSVVLYLSVTDTMWGSNHHYDPSVGRTQLGQATAGRRFDKSPSTFSFESSLGNISWPPGHQVPGGNWLMPLGMLQGPPYTVLTPEAAQAQVAARWQEMFDATERAKRKKERVAERAAQKASKRSGKLCALFVRLKQRYHSANSVACPGFKKTPATGEELCAAVSAFFKTKYFDPMLAPVGEEESYSVYMVKGKASQRKCAEMHARGMITSVQRAIKGSFIVYRFSCVIHPQEWFHVIR